MWNAPEAPGRSSVATGALVALTGTVYTVIDVGVVLSLSTHSLPALSDIIQLAAERFVGAPALRDAVATDVFEIGYVHVLIWRPLLLSVEPNTVVFLGAGGAVVLLELHAANNGDATKARPTKNLRMRFMAVSFKWRGGGVEPTPLALHS
jgi:hypothetical protein